MGEEKNIEQENMEDIEGGKEGEEVKVKKALTCEEKLAEMEGKYLRALADYQNLLRRTAEEKSEFMKYASEQFVLEILPVYDNLKISLLHVDEAAKGNGWAEGVRYIVKQFDEAMKNLGVEEIEVLGKKFDPALMDALEGEGDKVAKVVKTGYRLKGKVIAAAKVALGKNNFQI